MITFLKGQLVTAIPTQVIVDVHGVGYSVLIPLSSFNKLPLPGAEVTLLTHLSIREDAHVLYGFMSAAERDLFRLLINTVSGIGPKIALNVLSGMNAGAFRQAVVGSDISSLSQISGVGKKTAERIVVELKDKLGGLTITDGVAMSRSAGGEDQKSQDAILALQALGFKLGDAQDAVRGALALLGPSAKVEDLVRTSLKKP